MNICLKIFCVVIVANLFFGYVWSSERDASISNSRKKLCEDVKYGKLKLDAAHNVGSLQNAYLFNCSISIVVPFPDEKASLIRSRAEKKLTLADYFLSQDIDVNYKDESGGTLLMSVITSYMPSSWKIKVTKILISKGSDVNAKNKYGKSAIDLARFTGDSEIINILLMHID